MGPGLPAKGSAGFTLIEIIAVLVVLGILASVAVPRLLDFRADARAGAIEGALAAGSATLIQEFSRWLVDNPQGDSGDGELVRREDLVLGEFVATLVLECGSEASFVEITGGPTWWPDIRGGFADRLFNDRTSFIAGGGGGLGVVRRTYTICG